MSRYLEAKRFPAWTEGAVSAPNGAYGYRWLVPLLMATKEEQTIAMTVMQRSHWPLRMHTNASLRYLPGGYQILMESYTSRFKTSSPKYIKENMAYWFSQVARIPHLLINPWGSEVNSCTSQRLGWCPVGLLLCDWSASLDSPTPCHKRVL